MFIGFSFADPAITSVLRTLQRKRIPEVLPTHLAIVPDSAHTLQDELAAVNVRVVTYDDSDLQHPHGALWGSISAAARAISGRPAAERTPVRVLPLALEPARKALVAAYVQKKMGAHLPPLRDIVFSGMIAAAVSDSGELGMTHDELLSKLDACLPLTSAEIDALLGEPLKHLLDIGVLNERDSRLFSAPIENTFEPAMGVLVEGVRHRLNLRRAGRTRNLASDALPTTAIRDILDEVLVLRGWELGAHFAGEDTGAQIEAQGVLADAIRRHVPNSSPLLALDLEVSFVGLFERPTEGEAGVLAELGRLAFGVDVVFQLGHLTLLNPRALPDRIYLDANVALPVVVEGHPLRPVYLDTLNAWGEALLKHGREPQLLIGEPFLREMLKHRELSLLEVEQYRLNDPTRLKNYAILHGAHYPNVFVGAYATWVSTHGPISFEEWLSVNAPYRDDGQLGAFLEKRGIRVVSLEPAPTSRERLRAIHQLLESAYEGDSRVSHNQKAAVLIQDEALQLNRLESELNQKQRTLFVSADARLRRLVRQGELTYVGGGIVSHIGLIQLLDLFVGVQADARSLARLLWGIHSLDHQTIVREYLTNLALLEMDEVKTLALPSVLDKMQRELPEMMPKNKAALLYPRSEADHARAAEFYDRVENRFYELMDEAVAKFKAENK